MATADEGKDIRGLMTYMARVSAELSDWTSWATAANADDTAVYLAEVGFLAEELAERIERQIAGAAE
jgi:hypothetical protein